MITSYRREVVGRVSSMSYSSPSESCMVTTFGNGAFIFNTNKSIHETEHVELFPAHLFDYEPLTSSCFLGSSHEIAAVGSYNGGISLVVRSSSVLKGFYSSGHTDAVLSLQHVPSEANSLLFSTRHGAELVDLERNISYLTFDSPAPRAICSTALDPFHIAVAHYDGSVLLYDTRAGTGLTGILSVPDQLMCAAVCPTTSTLCVGTVAGRVFTLRGVEGPQREQAFGTGKERFPITALTCRNSVVVAGDLSGKVSVIDSTDTPKATRYWTGQSLLRPREKGGLEERALNKPPQQGLEIEVSAVAMGREGEVWTSFSTGKTSAVSHITSLPL